MSTTSLRPYLQLPHLLSLTWLAYPILSLVFIVFRLQLSSATAQSSVASAKSELLSSCKAAEKAATGAASYPRYMAISTNKEFADAVNTMMNGAREALVLTLTVMEAIINFIVDMYRSTFLCFLELVIRGALGILIAAADAVSTLCLVLFCKLSVLIRIQSSPVLSIPQLAAFAPLSKIASVASIQRFKPP